MINFPHLQFGHDEDIESLREGVRKFAEIEIAPLAAEADRNDQFPMPLWRKMGEMGVLGLTAPEAYGGANMGYLAHTIAMEEISRASASIGLSYGAMPSLIMAAVPVEQTVAANSLNNLMRALGTSFASAIAGVLLASLVTSAGVPTEMAFVLVMLRGAGAAIVALVIVWAIPPRSAPVASIGDRVPVPAR